MKDNSRFYVPVLTFLTLAAVIMLVSFWPNIPENVQSYICKPENCTVQDWLSSTAGWVGFFAAAIGAYWVYGQLNEQRKQTAFMLGDGDPTLSFESSDDAGTPIVFVLVNWNRRPIWVPEIRVTCEAPDFPEPLSIRNTYSNSDMGTDLQRYRKGPLDYWSMIPGWINRQNTPNHISFGIIFDEDLNRAFDNLNVIRDRRCKAIITVIFHHEYGKDIEISVQIPVRDFLPRAL